MMYKYELQDINFENDNSVAYVNTKIANFCNLFLTTIASNFVRMYE